MIYRIRHTSQVLADKPARYASRRSEAPGRTAPMPIPLYQQVKNHVKACIRGGLWPPNTKIPSETELSRTLGVSRMTANRALRELAAEGRLMRIQGVGTFVAVRKPQAAFLEINSIAREIRQNGGEHSSQVLLLRQESAPRELATIMGLPEGAPVYHSVLLHRDCGRPIQYADRYVNPAIAPAYLEQDFHVTTPSEYLCRVAPVTEVEHVIEAVKAQAHLRALLELEAGELCLLLHRITWVHQVVATKNRFFYPATRYRIGGRFRPSTCAQDGLV